MIKKLLHSVLLLVLTMTSAAYASNSDMTPPKPIFVAAPVYPQELIDEGITGKVLLEFVVTADGSVDEAKVIKTDNEGFNASAIACVEQWKFEPATQAGEAISFKVRLPLNFELSKEELAEMEASEAAE